MKQVNKIMFGAIFFSALSTFTACNAYEDEAPRIDDDNSYFYFPSPDLSATERAEYEAIKKEYKDNIGD